MRSFERDLVASRASQLPAVGGAVIAWIRGALARAWRGIETGARWTASVATERVQPVLAGPVKTLVVGRRTDVSVSTALAAVGIAGLVAWWVGSTSGYPPIVEWTTETFAGTDPHVTVFAGAAMLVGLGLLSAAVNAGLVPTSLLVMAPLFGLGLTRYATEYTHEVFGPQVVSLPEAVEFAAAVAVLGGLPLALIGFVLGVLLRHGLRTVEVPIDTVLARFDA